MPTNEVLAAAAFFLATFFAGLWNYKRKPTENAAPVVPSVIAGVGIELGNKEQMERLIEAVKGVSSAINDRKQDEVEDRIDRLLEMMERRERAER